MVKSLLKKATLVCLLCVLFVTKGNAVTADWYCDPHNGTYSVMDLSSFRTLTDGLAVQDLLLHNPYFVVMPRNLAAGESMTAHFKARCVAAIKSTRPFTLSASARDNNHVVLSSSVLTCKTNDWTADYAFPIYESTTCIDFQYNWNWNGLAKYAMLWIPMPVHLDVADFNMPDSVEVDEAIDLYIPINTFFLEEGVRNISITKANSNLNADEFTIVRGTVTPANRCGHNRWCDHDQRRYFADTRLPGNMFVVRFNPKAAGDRECEFTITSGSQSKTIRVKAKAFRRYVKYIAVGEGAVKLFVNHSKTPVAVPEGERVAKYEFQKGDHLRFVAVPTQCSHFVNWSTNPFHHFPIFDVVGVHTFAIHANFAPNAVKLNVVPSDPAHGRIFYDKNPKHHMCGANIDLTAAPAPGYLFMGWTPTDNPDSVISTDRTITLNIEGDTNITAQFVAAEEVFQIISETNNGINVCYSNPKNVANSNFLYSINGDGWEEYTIGDTIHLDKQGDLVYMRAKTVNTAVYSSQYTATNNDSHVKPAIFISDSASVAGNVMYLLHNLAGETPMALNCFQSLFASDLIVNAEDLILPELEIPDYAYHGMFRNCYILRNAPAVPATTIGKRCYSYMFMNCTTLVTAPELPANYVPYQSYEGMFRGCTSLIQGPELNASRIDSMSYRMMFMGCTSLENAPTILPAQKLYYYSYSQMFEGCNSLISAPVIEATQLEKACCMYMFKGCVSIETAPTLKATQLADYCYYSMFDGCTSLSKMEVSFSDWSTNLVSPTKDWTKGVAPKGVFNCPDELAKTRNTATKFNWIPTLWDINKASVSFSVNDPDMGSVVAEYTQGNIPIMSGEQIDFGKEVRFTATAEDGYVFDHFEDGDGNFIIAENPFAIVINEDRTIVAVFTETQAAPGAPVRSENASYVAIAEGMNIVIKGADNAKVCVYDAAGRLVEAIDNAANFETVNVETPGVYFVYVPGQYTTRVIVK